MYVPGDLVKYVLGKYSFKAKVVDIVSDVNGKYYALKVTSQKHPVYMVGTEVLVEIDDNRLKYRPKDKDE